MSKYMNIGEQIAYFRREKGYSQKQLSELCRVDASQIAKIEKGYNSPSVNTINKIAGVLGLILVLEERL